MFDLEQKPTMHIIYNSSYRNISVFAGFVRLGSTININGEDGVFISMFTYSYYEHIGLTIHAQGNTADQTMR